MAKMLGYTEGTNDIPTLRPAGERVKDFHQRTRLLTDEEAPQMASTCGNCKTDTCRDGATTAVPNFILETDASPWSSAPSCPLRNNIRGYLGAMARGDMDGAYAIDSATNHRPEYTGIVCPDNLCQGSGDQGGCFLFHAGHGSKHILPSEAYLGEYGAQKRTSAALMVASNAMAGKRIALIGAGPANEPIAQDMLTLNASVSIFDGADKPGGLLSRGIPGFKIANDTVYRNHDWLADNGAEYHMNTFIGRDIGFNEIAAQHDAIVIGIGTHKYKSVPNLKGSGKDAVIQAIPNLSVQNKRDDGMDPEGFEGSVHNANGKIKVIVGGGDTAFDEVGTALRQGAKKIVLLVSSKIGALDKEVRANTEEAQYIADQRGVALEEVLDIRIGQEIEEVHGTSDQVTAVTIKDRSGRTIETIDADIVSLAVSSDVPDLKKSWDLPNLKQKAGGIIPVIPILNQFSSPENGGRGGVGGGLVGYFMAEHDRLVPVFAVGDATRERDPRDPNGNPIPVPTDEQALVVTALRDGRNTTHDIVHALQNHEAVHDQYGHLGLNKDF